MKQARTEATYRSFTNLLLFGHGSLCQDFLGEWDEDRGAHVEVDVLVPEQRLHHWLVVPEHCQAHGGHPIAGRVLQDH